MREHVVRKRSILCTEDAEWALEVRVSVAEWEVGGDFGRVERRGEHVIYTRRVSVTEVLARERRSLRVFLLAR